MKNGKKTGRRFFVISALSILFCIMFLGSTGIAAEDTDKSGQRAFDIDAYLLPSGNRTFDIQLTVGNQGADWEGTVRVRMENSYDSSDCVYDTVISLPQGSTKRFVVRIPKDSMEYTGGDVIVSLLDKKYGVTAEKVFKRLFLNGVDAFAMGILSDSYQSLMYLDMGGEALYYGGVELPIKLVELDQDNLAGFLDSLTFLVIDNYNTGILTEEAADSIRQWMNDGGMLIVGTGSRAEEVLSGLDYLGIERVQVKEPEEGSYGEGYNADLSQLPMAELKDTGGQYEVELKDLIMLSSWGDGAVEVVPYSLSDLGKLDFQDWKSYVWELLRVINGYTQIQPGYGKMGYYYDNYYILHRIFRTFGNGGNRLNFGVLKLIVIVYVIFVGPILYLILRAMKKRDLYWIAVPVTTLVGILLVYFAGRGFEVVNTRVYSVTVENLSNQNSDTVTYMHCYDAGHKEWKLQLAEGYEYVGPVLKNYYSADENKYHNHICREGERISVGLNPGAGFEDCYFLAGTTRKTGTGSISSDIKTSAQWGITGTVTNGTNRDFKYLAVIFDNDLYVYGELPAGETCNLQRSEYTSEQESYDSAVEAYLHGYMSNYYRGKGKKDVDITAALGTGVCAACFAEDPHATLIIGVTENWDKTVDDDCTETSYGCLYAVQ